MAGVMIGAGSHKAPHTAVAISGVEEPPGQLRVCQRRAGGAAASVGCGLAGADRGSRRGRQPEPPAAPSSCCRQASGSWTCSPSWARGS
jgi:hypothetical protein